MWGGGGMPMKYAKYVFWLSTGNWLRFGQISLEIAPIFAKCIVGKAFISPHYPQNRHIYQKHMLA